MNLNQIKSTKVDSNDSGLIPLGFKVLVKMDSLEEKSEGGIIMHTGTAKDIEEAACQSGRVVDYGKAAFTIGVSDLPNEWDIKPDVGTRVLVNKYAGIQVDGQDNCKYRFLSDKEIIAIFSE